VSRWTVLRHRDFRLLWVAGLASGIGSQMQVLAVNWQMLQLLGGHVFRFSLAGFNLHFRADALGLGTLGLARVLPIMALALIGGLLADTQDRRRIIMMA